MYVFGTMIKVNSVTENYSIRSVEKNCMITVDVKNAYNKNTKR